jgi:hypothetical protein
MEADTLYIINLQSELLSWVSCTSGISDIDLIIFNTSEVPWNPE